MSKDLRCGVAGAGVFGGYHADHYSRLAGARLSGVYDVSLERARALAERFSAPAFDDLEEFLHAVDLVSVTSPASTHAGVASRALKRGRHAYVEKPLATTLEDAETLAGLASDAGLVLAAGHQERIQFQAMGLLDLPERPLALSSVRRGLANVRNRDVSCVLDLMIHDLDLAFALDPEEVLAVEAEGRAPVGPFADEVRAEATFESGMTAVFEASRIADARDRRMKVVFPSGEVEIDFLERTFRNTTPFALDPGFAETPLGRDPLGAALKAFVGAARGEGPRAVAGPQDALRALDLALAIEQALEI
jgi:predicted dehydrogenase